jgi:hypothetical protein
MLVQVGRVYIARHRCEGLIVSLSPCLLEGKSAASHILGAHPTSVQGYARICSTTMSSSLPDSNDIATNTESNVPNFTLSQDSVSIPDSNTGKTGITLPSSSNSQLQRPPQEPRVRKPARPSDSEVEALVREEAWSSVYG